ncbi:MAG: arginine--tRNA ligase [Candidatus Omnitrophica bacterium]|nr:arginine--tRNA ligase [Candidatus Omnitrophota bacterium]
MTAIEETLHQLLRDAVSGEAVADGFLRWEIPKDPSFGDLSNAVPFKLAAGRRQPPQRIAEDLSAAFLTRCREAGVADWIERVEAKAGFLNIFLSQRALTRVLRQILRQRRRYGTHRPRQRQAVTIEFVSANPTGPLSVAHGRQAAVGDVLARLLRSQGARVTTEFYLNDEGRQIELLGRSLRARYLQQLGHEVPFPEDGYHGRYVTEFAAKLARARRDRLREAPESTFARLGMGEMLRDIQADLARFGLAFDRWVSQQALRTSGRIDEALRALRERGALYESDDATWFASTTYGDDKDRVVRKRDGELTYLAPDIAYHRWKFQRGYDQVINLWGPDHHGYIGRLTAALAALGLPAERLVVRIVQLVTLSRKGVAVPMSKRQGEFVTFREVLDEVGVDATRFFYLMRTMESHLDFDLELAKAQSQENPVYYVQYAHARICSILAKAQKVPGTFWHFRRPDLQLLEEPEERLLLRGLFQYPIVLRLCAGSLEPHGLTAYLRKLAETFHVFYTKRRVISEDRERSAARLALVRATRQVLENGLGILGVRAPRRM